mmetsp:Transcript_108936/g.347782  ORF Transcript_108936/g.347782 Transcript_108936/m.347782 type:complete len:1126 (-) Transcript_108936:303-3680(-)
MSAVMAYAASSERQQVEGPPRRDLMVMTSPTYDCSSSSSQALELWSQDQCNHCCASAGVGCSSGQATQPMHDWYDCGTSSYVAQIVYWSAERRAWCCTNRGRGCAQGPAMSPCPQTPSVPVATPCQQTPLATTPLPPRYDCQAGLLNWEAGWSDGKKSWCCSNYKVGCPIVVVTMAPVATTTPCSSSEAYDCQAGLQRWQTGWSDSKKVWCCATYQVGCLVAATTTVGTYYDCNLDYATWHQTWSSAKKAWCCDDCGKGCPGNSLYDCNEARECKSRIPYDLVIKGYPDWVMIWSYGKKDYCCRHGGRGCPTTTVQATSEPFDCGVGWQSAWLQEKMDWCCRREGLGCPATTTTLAFNCEYGAADWRTAWTVEKQTWCCDRVDVGCTTTEFNFDCYAGLSNWVRGWSIEKKDWCCKKMGRGCPTTPTPGYDCDADYSTWRSTWAQAKRKWCCDSIGRGCTDVSPVAPATSAPCPTTPTYDCDDGLADSKHWDAGKKVYCCSKHFKGCEGESSSTRSVWDCEAGLADYMTAWDARKKEWCCLNEKKGCVPTTTPEIHYDCVTGVQTWPTLWDDDQKRWCCDNQGVGCQTITSTTTITRTTTLKSINSYDCESDFSDWEQKWGPVHKAWCCEHQGKGCFGGVDPAKCSTLECRSGWTFKPNADSLFCSLTKCGDQDQTTCCELLTTPGPPANPTCDTMQCPNGDPNGDGWFAKADHQSFHCTGNPCDVSVDTLVCCDKALTCDLNCYGDGGKSVQLKGATGDQVNGLTLQQCQDTCISSAGCEAVVFAQAGGQCWGRQDIHTSKCQPADAHQTHILRARPWGKCVLMGDPHIIPFDRPFGPNLEALAAGDYWLIKSNQLQVQGRFDVTERFPDDASTTGIAVGGPLVGDHSFVVAYLGPAMGPAGFRMTWDGKVIFAEQEAQLQDPDGKWDFASVDDDFQAEFGKMDPSSWHREARHTIAQGVQKIHSFKFTFKQASLNIYLILGPDNFNTIIEAKKVPGPQDGYCGNFNCNPDDDAVEALKGRDKAQAVDWQDEENMFGKDESGTWGPVKKVGDGVPMDALENCDPAVLENAKTKCRGLPAKNQQDACIFDACAAGKASVGKATNADLATAAWESQIESTELENGQ